MFKVGDKVRCVIGATADGVLRSGEVYTVKYVHHGLTDPTYDLIDIMDARGIFAGGWFEDRFVLADGLTRAIDKLK